MMVLVGLQHFSFSFVFPSSFQFRSNDINNTVQSGIPAWGSGQFNPTLAWLGWAACFLGFSGVHRIYLGDICMGIVYCLTGGLCLIGQVIDCCSLSTTVNSKNQEIRNAVQQKADALASQPTVVISTPQSLVAPGQPQYYQPPPQIYSSQPAQPQVYSAPPQTYSAQPPVTQPPVQPAVAYSQPPQNTAYAQPPQNPGYTQPPQTYLPTKQ